MQCPSCKLTHSADLLPSSERGRGIQPPARPERALRSSKHLGYPPRQHERSECAWDGNRSPPAKTSGRTDTCGRGGGGRDGRETDLSPPPHINAMSSAMLTSLLPVTAAATVRPARRAVRAAVQGSSSGARLSCRECMVPGGRVLSAVRGSVAASASRRVALSVTNNGQAIVPDDEKSITKASHCVLALSG